MGYLPAFMKIFFFTLLMLLAKFTFANNITELDICQLVDNETEIDVVDNVNQWGFAILVASLIFGKSVELAFLPECYKPIARGVGKFSKAFQSRQGAIEMFGSGVSGFAAFVLSQQLQKSQFSNSHIAATSILVVSMQQFLQQPGNWEGFNYWFGKPVLYKTLSLTCRYALEKRLQFFLRSNEVLRYRIDWIMTHTLFSEASVKTLTKSTVVGMSKIASSALASSTISIVDISLDAMREDPQWKTLSDRLQKYLADIGVAIGSSFVISVVMPVTLVSSTPRVLIGMFVVGNTIHWVFFS